MPVIPTYQRQVDQPTYRFAPAQPAEEFERTGEEAYRMQLAMGRAQHAQDMVDVAQAAEKRDVIYRQRAMERMKNPDQMADQSPEEFQKVWQEQATEDDKAIAEGLKTDGARHYAAIQFARMNKQAFDRDFNEYRRIWVDRQNARVKDVVDADAQKAGLSADPDEKQFYHNHAFETIGNAESSGVTSANDARQLRKHFSDQVLTSGALSQMIDDPDKALEALKGDQYAGLDPLKRQELIKTAIEAGKRRDAENERNYKKWQEDNYETAALKGDRGELSLDEVTQLERDRKINRAQANELRGITGKPGEQIAPGVAQDILTELSLNGYSGAAMAKAKREAAALFAKYPRDPGIREIMDKIKSEQHMQIDEGRRNQNRDLDAANTQFDVWMHSQFHMPGMAGQMQRNKWAAAKDQMRLDIRRGMPAEQAYQKALKSVQREPGQKSERDKAAEQMQEDAR